MKFKHILFLVSFFSFNYLNTAEYRVDDWSESDSYSSAQRALGKRRSVRSRMMLGQSGVGTAGRSFGVKGAPSSISRSRYSQEANSEASISSVSSAKTPAEEKKEMLLQCPEVQAMQEKMAQWKLGALDDFTLPAYQRLVSVVQERAEAEPEGELKTLLMSYACHQVAQWNSGGVPGKRMHTLHHKHTALLGATSPKKRAPHRPQRRQRFAGKRTAPLVSSVARNRRSGGTAQRTLAQYDALRAMGYLPETTPAIRQKYVNEARQEARNSTMAMRRTLVRAQKEKDDELVSASQPSVLDPELRYTVISDEEFAAIQRKKEEKQQVAYAGFACAFTTDREAMREAAETQEEKIRRIKQELRVAAEQEEELRLMQLDLPSTFLDDEEARRVAAEKQEEEVRLLEQEIKRLKAL